MQFSRLAWSWLASPRVSSELSHNHRSSPDSGTLFHSTVGEGVPSMKQSMVASCPSTTVSCVRGTVSVIRAGAVRTQGYLCIVLYLDSLSLSIPLAHTLSRDMLSLWCFPLGRVTVQRYLQCYPRVHVLSAWSKGGVTSKRASFKEWDEIEMFCLAIKFHSRLHLSRNYIHVFGRTRAHYSEGQCIYRWVM